MNYRIIRIFIIIGFVVAVIVVAFLIIQRLLYATIEINLPQNTSVAIVRIDSEKSDAVWSSNEERIHSVRLPKGSYYINFNTNNQYSQYFDNIGYREKKSYKPIFRDYQETLLLDKDSSTALTSSENGSPVYFESNNTITGLDSNLQPNKYEISAKSVVFGSPQSKYRYLSVDNFGYGYFVSANSADLAFEIFNDESGATQEVIISADYDSGKNEYCTLLSDGSVNTFDSNTLTVKSIGRFEGSTKIKCSKGVVAVSNISRPNDGEDERENGEITIIKEGVVVGNLENDKPITKVEVVSNNKVAYLQNNDLVLSSLDFKDKNRIAYVSSPDTVHFFTNKNPQNNASDILYIFRDGSLWELDINQNVEYRISSSALFKFVSEATVLNNQFAFSVPIGPNKGTYITSNDDNLISSWKAVNAKKPTSNADYLITPTISNNKILLTVTILAPVPSSGDMTYYNLAKESAEKEIELIGLDPTLYSVVFN